MRVAAVVALDVVVHHDLPSRVLARIAQNVDGMRVHLQVAEPGHAPAKVGLHLPREAREALRVVVEIDEDAVAEELEPNRTQGEIGLVEARPLRREAGCAQPALAFVGPGVIGADDGRAHVAAGLAQQLVPAVAAHVVEGAQDAVASLHDEDVLVADRERHVVSRLREGGPVRDVLPGAVEDGLLLPLEHRRTRVVLRRQGERGPRLVGDGSLHCGQIGGRRDFVEHRLVPRVR